MCGHDVCIQGRVAACTPDQAAVSIPDQAAVPTLVRVAACTRGLAAVSIPDQAAAYQPGRAVVFLRGRAVGYQRGQAAVSLPGLAEDFTQVHTVAAIQDRQGITVIRVTGLPTKCSRKFCVNLVWQTLLAILIDSISEFGPSPRRWIGG
jgi:hypothetical protein